MRAAFHLADVAEWSDQSSSRAFGWRSEESACRSLERGALVRLKCVPFSACLSPCGGPPMRTSGWRMARTANVRGRGWSAVNFPLAPARATARLREAHAAGAAHAAGVLGPFAQSSPIWTTGVPVHVRPAARKGPAVSDLLLGRALLSPQRGRRGRSLAGSNRGVRPLPESGLHPMRDHRRRGDRSGRA